MVATGQVKSWNLRMLMLWSNFSRGRQSTAFLLALLILSNSLWLAFIANEPITSLLQQLWRLLKMNSKIPGKGQSVVLQTQPNLLQSNRNSKLAGSEILLKSKRKKMRRRTHWKRTKSYLKLRLCNLFWWRWMWFSSLNWPKSKKIKQFAISTSERKKNAK